MLVRELLTLKEHILQSQKTIADAEQELDRVTRVFLEEHGQVLYNFYTFFIPKKNFFFKKKKMPAKSPQVWNVSTELRQAYNSMLDDLICRHGRSVYTTTSKKNSVLFSFNHVFFYIQSSAQMEELHDIITHRLDHKGSLGRICCLVKSIE